MNHPKYMDAFIQANFLPHTDLARFPSVGEKPAARATPNQKAKGAKGAAKA